MKHIACWVAGLVLALPSVATAQAWVNAKGELSLTLRSDFQTSQGVWHGSELVTGLPAQAINSAFAIEYVPIEKLSLGLTLNSNAARYTGPASIPGNSTVILSHGSQDDGSFHFNVTDLDLDLHYQLYDGVVAIAPVLHLRTPVTDYENRGYGAAGIGLREGGLGFTIGKYGLGLDDLVVQLGYAFTYVEKESAGGEATEQFRTNRSDIDLSLSYVITDKLTAGIGVSYRMTHDGFDLEDYPSLMSDDPLREWHDPVLKVSYLATQAVVNYQINDSWSVLGRFAAIVYGRNSSNPLMFGASVSYSNNLLD